MIGKEICGQQKIWIVKSKPVLDASHFNQEQNKVFDGETSKLGWTIQIYSDSDTFLCEDKRYAHSERFGLFGVSHSNC